jgi:ferredoxin
MPYIVTDTCILCGACSAGCPTDAITENETQAQIDDELCIECGTCEGNCLVEAIIFITDLDD